MCFDLIFTDLSVELSKENELKCNSNEEKIYFKHKKYIERLTKF